MAELGNNTKYHFNLRKFVFDDKYKDLVMPKEVTIKHYLCGRGKHGSAAKACACYKDGYEEGSKDVEDLNDFAHEIIKLGNRLLVKEAKRASDRVNQELEVIKDEEAAKSLMLLDENALDSLPLPDEKALTGALEMEKIVVGTQDMPPLEEPTPMEDQSFEFDTTKAKSSFERYLQRPAVQSGEKCLADVLAADVAVPPPKEFQSDDEACTKSDKI